MKGIFEKILKKIIKEEKGATMVIVALGMVVFLGFAAIVTDIGILYTKRTQMVNAVDAAALAGAQELPGDPYKAGNIALEYAEKNGLEPERVTVNISADNKKITVETKNNVNLFFARALGINSRDITARATAGVGPIKSVVGAAPLAVQQQDFFYGEEYILKQGSGSTIKEGESWSGWYGALALEREGYSGGGANQYEENFKKGFNRELRIGDVIPTESGNMSGPTSRSVDYLLRECKHVPQCTYDNYQPDCPKILLIPVIDILPYDINHTQNVTIVGFASFFLEEVGGSGNDNYVKGRFINYRKVGDIDFDEHDYGLYGVKLIQ